MPQINIYAKPDAVLSGLPESGRVNNVINVTLTTTNPNFSFIEEHGEFVYNAALLSVTNILYQGSTITADITLLAETPEAQLYWRSKNVWLGLSSNTQTILINPPGPDENAEVGFGWHGAVISNYVCVTEGRKLPADGYVTVNLFSADRIVTVQVDPALTWTQPNEAQTVFNNTYSCKIINRESGLEYPVVFSTDSAGTGKPPIVFTNASGTLQSNLRINACLCNSSQIIALRVNQITKALPAGTYDLEVYRKPAMVKVNNPFFFTVSY